MNVLFLTSTLPRFMGDQQAPFVLEQAAAWKRARPDDKLIILAPHDEGAEISEQIDGVLIERFTYMRPLRFQRIAYPAILPNLRAKPWLALQIPGFLLGQYRAAKRLIRDHDIDLVYAHWVMPQGIVAERLKRKTGVPYFLQNHSSDLAVFSKFGGLGKALARHVLRNARGFFCVNSMQRQAAQEVFASLEPHVLPMGVSLRVGDARVAAKASDFRFALGTISRLSRKKGLDHLISAAEVLAKDGQRPRIGIAGDGEDAEVLKGLPKASDVTFTASCREMKSALSLTIVLRWLFRRLRRTATSKGSRFRYWRRWLWANR